MDKAQASLPAEPERQWIVALSMADSDSGDGSVHVAVVEHVGAAMRDWDTSTRGDSWTSEPVDEAENLPPLRLHEPQAGSGSAS